LNLGTLLRHLATCTLLAATMVSGTGCRLPWQKKPAPVPGAIIFGLGIRRLSAHEIDVVKPRNTFRRGQSVAWVAYLKRRADARSLTLTIVSASRTHSVIRNQTVGGVNPAWNEVANPGEPVSGFLLLGLNIPGRYTMQYSNGNAALARGTFRLRN
jgi:hypothetical protein